MAAGIRAVTFPWVGTSAAALVCSSESRLRPVEVGLAFGTECSGRTRGVAIAAPLFSVATCLSGADRSFLKERISDLVQPPPEAGIASVQSAVGDPNPGVGVEAGAHAEVGVGVAVTVGVPVARLAGLGVTAVGIGVTVLVTVAVRPAVAVGVAVRVAD